MEVIGVAAIVASLGFTLFYVQLQRGAADRARDTAEWREQGAQSELDLAARKLAAQSETIATLTRLLLDSDVDPRSVVAAISLHDRMLREADADSDSAEDELRTDPETAGDPVHAGELLPGGGLLERPNGDGGSGVRDPRVALGRRGPSVPGEDE